MSKLYVITAAFCKAEQLAHMLMCFDPLHNDFEHIFINCHYPINYEENQKSLKVILESYQKIHKKTTLLDPGGDIGSAQSQNWALNQINIEDGDYFINLDPDSACFTPGWEIALLEVMLRDSHLTVLTLMSPMVDEFVKEREIKFQIKQTEDFRYGIPDKPTPFNLSLWRYSFIKQIGGIPQMFPWYGEVEGPIHGIGEAHGMYHAYLLDIWESENGKRLHDTVFQEWKDRHARTAGEHQFLGNLKEFIEFKKLRGKA